MDINVFRNKPYINKNYNSVVCVDEKNDIVEIRVSSPLKLGGEADMHYNLQPDMQGVLTVYKENCTNVMIVDPKLLQSQDVIPGRRPWVISEIKYDDNNVYLREKGIGGARERILAAIISDSVKSYEIHHYGEYIDATLVMPRYNKVVIGLDSTDTKLEGCTMYLAHNTANILENEMSENVKYIKTQPTLLCCKVPHKTQNNTASSITLAVKSGFEKTAVQKFKEIVLPNCLSDSAYMLAMYCIKIPESLIEFGKRAKYELIEISEAEAIIEKLNIEKFQLTGIMGIVEATAALGLSNDAIQSTYPGFKRA